jgi:hypothetical protein
MDILLFACLLRRLLATIWQLTHCCKWLMMTKSNSKSKLRYGRRSVCQSDLVSNCTWGSRPDFCYWQTVEGFFMWSAHSEEITGLYLHSLLVLASAVIFSTVKISTACHLYLQFYMSAFYIDSCQESGSLWACNVYSLSGSSSMCEGGSVNRSQTHIKLKTCDI